MSVRWFLALALAALVGCHAPAEPGDEAGSPDAGSPDAGSPDAAPARCTVDADCDDGQFCNGAERCREGDDGARQCSPGSTPCGAGTFCDEAADRCELTCAIDADGDGSISRECGGPDCDDADPRRYPGAAELCDAEHVDEDCDATTFGDRDADGDGWADAACCNRIGDTLRCGDDCDDADPGVHRTASEVCDGFDNDCDGAVDERVSYRLWPDADRDGFGDRDATPIDACTFMPGFALVGEDCDDLRASTNPGTHDVCNGVDDDCDGAVDEGAAALCATAPGVTGADCVQLGGEPAPRCVVVACEPALLDCNLDPADGCEASFCAQGAHCGACASEGGGCPIGQFCNGGRCAPDALRVWVAAGRVVRAGDGAPIAGARISRIRDCSSAEPAVSDVDGTYNVTWDFERPFVRLRTEADGYAARLDGPETWGEIPLLEQAELDALLALSPVTVNRNLGIVVIDSWDAGVEIVEPVTGTYRAPAIPASAPYTVPLADGRTRIVYVNVRPGVVRVRAQSAGDARRWVSCNDHGPDWTGEWDAPAWYDSLATSDAIVHVQFGWCQSFSVGG